MPKGAAQAAWCQLGICVTQACHMGRRGCVGAHLVRWLSGLCPVHVRVVHSAETSEMHWMDPNFKVRSSD